jgi:segregation and condensation protein A
MERPAGDGAAQGGAAGGAARSFEPPGGFESRFRGMALDLPLYEGPLDLLLHLIRSQRLDILDLPMATVTRQYMDFLLLMEELDLEIAAEFVAMAAHLVQIKSRLLLPVPPKEGEAGDSGDPRADLVQRLLEYEAVRGAAMELAGRGAAWADVVYTAGLPVREPQEPAGEDGTFEAGEGGAVRVTLMDLLAAYREALARLLPPPPVEVRAPSKTLQQRIAEVMEMLRAPGAQGGAAWLPFGGLLAASRGREELVLTFLALLELAKNGSVRLVQTEAFGEIRVQAA